MTISNIASVKSMAQEATETLAQTKAEAAKGDQQAIRKLAALQVAGGGPSSPKPVDADADGDSGKLDAKA
jgi:hypothetical protein